MSALLLHNVWLASKVAATDWKPIKKWMFSRAVFITEWNQIKYNKVASRINFVLCFNLIRRKKAGYCFECKNSYRMRRGQLLWQLSHPEYARKVPSFLFVLLHAASTVQQCAASDPKQQQNTHLSPSFLSMSSLNLCAPPPVALMTLVSVLTRWSLMKSRHVSM